MKLYVLDWQSGDEEDVAIGRTQLSMCVYEHAERSDPTRHGVAGSGVDQKAFQAVENQLETKRELVGKGIAGLQGVLLDPVLAGFGRSIALGYLSARIAEAILLGAGILALFLLVPMSQQPAPDSSLAILARDANAYAYQFAMIALGVGSLPMCALLYRASLVLRGLAAASVVGYAALLAGAVLELFGIGVGLMLSIPGGVFEVALGSWLIARGFVAPVRIPEQDAVGNLARA